MPFVESLETRVLLSGGKKGPHGGEGTALLVAFPPAVNGPFAVTIRFEDLGKTAAKGDVAVRFELSPNPDGSNAYSLGTVVQAVHLRPKKSTNVPLEVPLPANSPAGEQYLVAVVLPGGPIKGGSPAGLYLVTPQPILVKSLPSPSPTPTPTPSPTPPPLASFDGKYSGTYQGVVSQAYGSVSGGVDVHRERWGHHRDGTRPGAGNVRDNGSTSFGSSLSDYLFVITFTGTFVREPNGTVVASGSWSFSGVLIGGYGSWTVTMTQS